MMQELWKKNKENIKKDLNVIILCLYIFLPIFFLPVSVLLGERVYKIVFLIFNILFVALSYYKNKKIITIRDIVLTIILFCLFLIDFLLRKNSYTMSIYYIVIRTILIPFYYFDRIENKKDILKYLSLFAKVAVVMFLFDPLLHYFFTSTYMGYGFSIMLPSFLAIYIYHFIEPKENDYLFLILSAIGIVVFANRNCTLAILFALVLTFGFIKERFKNRKKIIKNIKLNFKKIIIKNFTIIGLLALSFGINYAIVKIDYAKNNPIVQPVDNTKNNSTTKKNDIDKNNVEGNKNNSDKNNDKVINDPSKETQNKSTDISSNNGKEENKNSGSNNTNISNNPSKNNNDKVTNNQSSNVKTEQKDDKVVSNGDDFDLNLRSYSFDKYFQVLTGKTDRILSGRIKIYKDVFTVIERDILSSPISLIFGRGTGYFMSLYKGVYTHCIFFDLFIEYGIIGSLIFLSLLVYCIFKFAKLYKKDKNIYLLGVYFLTIAFPKLLLSSHFQKEIKLFLFIFLILSIYPIDYKKIVGKLFKKK